ncbi:MAG: hypothetical protein Q9225_003005 [Loekoesia sp. 1 TL-2023]
MAWTQPVRERNQYKIPVAPDLVIYVQPLGSLRRNPLNNGHLMLGIYDAVLHMSDHGFLPTLVELVVSGNTVGIACFTRLPDGISTSKGTAMEHVEENNIVVKSKNGESGTIVAPWDPKKAVEFRHTGRKVQSRDIFTLIMQALIIINYDGSLRPFRSLDAVTESGSSALHMHAIGNEQPDPELVADLLPLVAGVFIPRRGQAAEFDEMEFTLEYGEPSDRKRMVEGWFLLLGEKPRS